MSKPKPKPHPDAPSTLPRNGPRARGRPRGSKNKRSAAGDKRTAEVIERLNITPLEYFASVYQDQEQPLEFRMEAAKAAAPYVHRKMPQAMEHSGSLQATVAYELPDNGRGDAPAPGPVAHSSAPEGTVTPHAQAAPALTSQR